MQHERHPVSSRPNPIRPGEIDAQPQGALLIPLRLAAAPEVRNDRIGRSRRPRYRMAQAGAESPGNRTCGRKNSPTHDRQKQKQQSQRRV
ncbi:hypothetical protein Y88_2282 [Novosphingobium nitrogenifigens DSM 19370]|uniref:Uncharacterized protein n=1 Tax=Novosphingobium nitrogenifigens DSM 19370 TaxID=983920 RepID=F1Z660_9SPHN|nr:hypothetical protein Y88_2282 [Novosphingobium nitrogenifigens DSM 19370]